MIIIKQNNMGLEPRYLHSSLISYLSNVTLGRLVTSMNPGPTSRMYRMLGAIYGVVEGDGSLWWFSCQYKHNTNTQCHIRRLI